MTGRQMQADAAGKGEAAEGGRRHLTPHQVAEILEVSVWTAMRMMDTGAIPGSYVVPGGGNFRRVPRLDLIQWMANHAEWHPALVKLCGPLPPGWPGPHRCGPAGRYGEGRPTPSWTRPEGGPGPVSVADLRVACAIAEGATRRRDLRRLFADAPAALVRLKAAGLVGVKHAEFDPGGHVHHLTMAGFRATAAMRANPREERDAAGEAEAN